MRKTAALVFGLWLGCGGPGPHAAVGGRGGVGAPEAGLLGVYDCSIGNAADHYQYDFFRCVIVRRKGSLVLDKQGGSQRFIGAIAATPDGGFSFTGRFYCPYGDCEQPLVGTFAAVESGPGQPTSQFHGAFVDSPLLVTLRWRSSTGAEFGGDGYGGDGYGGVTYGASGGYGDDSHDGQRDGGQGRDGVNGANR